MEQNQIKTETNQLTLILDIKKITKKEFVFSYKAINTTKEKIYLINRLYHTDIYGNRKIDPNLVYIEFKNGIIYLSKKMVEIPEEIDVEYPEVPYLTLLEQNQIFEETIKLFLPLREYSPYISQKREEKFSTSIGSVFSLGYFISTPDIEIDQFEKNGEKILEVDYGSIIEIQNVISTNRLEINLPIKW